MRWIRQVTLSKLTWRQPCESSKRSERHVNVSKLKYVLPVKFRIARTRSG